MPRATRCWLRDSALADDAQGAEASQSDWHCWSRLQAFHPPSVVCLRSAGREAVLKPQTCVAFNSLRSQPHSCAAQLTMTLSLATSFLAGPGMDDVVVVEPPKVLHISHPELRPSSKVAPRRVKVTAMVTRRPDDTEFTTYKVEEIVDDSSDTPLTPPKPFDYRRIRSQSESTVRSDDSILHTPTSPFRGLPLVEWPLSPPRAPRVSFPPSPKQELSSPRWDDSLSARRGVGLGLDLSGCHHKKQSSVSSFRPGQWGAIGEERHGAGYEGSKPFTPSTSSMSSSSSEEEPYYHLPSNLFSPELEMSATEFKESVLHWMKRRKETQCSTNTTTPGPPKFS
ncbi:hypothetical protein PHLGIDRAFT_393051 [Phlebiopsis gigantea 11061_1 CR5-6]|uniref:Uncharacterized protein n=1 Tax=Phlebiopsis gigantea (strain 11061_1 CR5-6) TaxID=745531 RepID=A0A0C3PMU5_PHLG1|nr:hypothetical protein PHLGIDRAFT_393051 [Phlebiopsis gigantea 11061_1 CR5-6]